MHQRKFTQLELDLIQLAEKYDSPSDFSRRNRPKYLIADRKNLIKVMWPDKPKAKRPKEAKTEIVKGVYILYDGPTIIYIGKSTANVYSRISNHYASGMEYTQYEVYKIDNEALVHLMEIYLIGKHKPILNSDCTTLDELPFLIPQLEELLVNPIIGSDRPTVRIIRTLDETGEMDKRSYKDKLKDYFNEKNS